MPRFRYLLLLALAAYLLTGLTQVRPGERAVVRRFGQVVARPEAGLWVGWPWGIDRVDRVPVRSVRQLKAGIDPETAFDAPRIPVGQFLTGDQNLVNVQLILDYAIGETDVDLDDFVMHQDKVDVALGARIRSDRRRMARRPRRGRSCSDLAPRHYRRGSWSACQLGSRP